MSSPPPKNQADEDHAELTPLALMLALMREKWRDGDRDGAVKLACAAAPYLHPRRIAGPSSVTPQIEAHRLSDADLCRHLADADGGTGAAAEDP